MTKAFAPFGKLLVPVIHGCDSAATLAAARAIGGAGRIALAGFVAVAESEALSAASAAARQVRRQLTRLQDQGDSRLRARPRVRVSHAPWQEVIQCVAEESPDLLLLDYDCHLKALGTTVDEALTSPPCDVVIVRGSLAAPPERVLVALRGGPHAELALRLGLSLSPNQLTALHIGRTGDHVPADAPFRGLRQVLAALPEVERRVLESPDPGRTIVEQSADYDLVVLGATIQPAGSRASLGPAAQMVLERAPAAVAVVKSRRLPPAGELAGETAGGQAISILVDKWFAENTYKAGEFANLKQLVALKQAQGLTISLALPALNEAATVGKVIRTIQSALMEEVPLLDEIVLIDSNSTDATREIAASLSVPVHIHQELLPELGARRGKGEALWKSLLVTRGDILAWIDTDIVNIHPRFVYGILGPLLVSRRIQFVKGFYRRPLKVGEIVQAGGGGRVTELAARPLFNLFYPELSGIIQPLSGEYAGRRRALEQLPFFSGYGVETGLLIDILEHYGLSAIAQVDLLERIHHSQPLEALSKMSFAIIQAVIRKLETRYERNLLSDVNKTMKLVRHGQQGYSLHVEEIAERERPPIVSLPPYQARHNRPEGGA